MYNIVRWFYNELAQTPQNTERISMFNKQIKWINALLNQTHISIMFYINFSNFSFDECFRGVGVFISINVGEWDLSRNGGEI